MCRLLKGHAIGHKQSFNSDWRLIWRMAGRPLTGFG